MMTITENQRQHLMESSAMLAQILQMLSRNYPRIAPDIASLEQHAGESIAILQEAANGQ